MLAKKSVLVMTLSLLLAGAVVASETVVPATTSFVAHYNGDTDNGGCDADYALGSSVASTASGGFPQINSSSMKFGSGSLNLDWWSGRSLEYSADQNFDSAKGTIEFQLNLENIFTYDETQEKYLFDGTKRYVFNDDLAWGTAGHIDMWIDGTAGEETARLIIHINTGAVQTIMAPPIKYDWGNYFEHYAFQWDAETGQTALFYGGKLFSKDVFAPWKSSISYASVFKIGMQAVNVSSIQLDELRISNSVLYDDSMEIGDGSFVTPILEYEPTNELTFLPTTTFVAHYNGSESYDPNNFDKDDPLSYNGLNADYALGSPIVSIQSPDWGVPTITNDEGKFGGAVELPWWSGRAMKYACAGNYDNTAATVDFQVNIKNVFMEYNGSYVFDGTRRYIFTDNLAWAAPGHVTMWIDGTAGTATARLVVNIFAERNGSPVTISFMGPPVPYEYGQDYWHYAVQWDADTGEVAIFCEGLLKYKDTVAPWSMPVLPDTFNVGMNSANKPKLLLDELRISSEPLYDTTVALDDISFIKPWAQYPIDCQLVRIPGDATNDREVDLLDMAVMAANWNKAVANEYDDADFDKDGDVDTADLRILSENWLFD